MRALLGLTWRRRSLTAVILAIGAAMTLMVAGAFADAGNPILGTIKATAQDNGNGTVTIYVRGQWNWLSHTTDCNSDRNGAGVGIIWSDRNGVARDITTATRSGSTVTITTATTQTYAAGDSITVSGVSGGTGFDGTVTITSWTNSDHSNRFKRYHTRARQPHERDRQGSGSAVDGLRRPSLGFLGLREERRPRLLAHLLEGLAERTERLARPRLRQLLRRARQ